MQIKVNHGLCRNELPIASSLGGLVLPSKFCVLPAGHDGPHTDGSAVWLNVAKHNEELATRNLPNARQE